MIDIKIVGKSNLEMLIDVIGNGFHPDNHMTDYVNGDNKPLFNDTEATYYQGMLDTAWEAFGEEIYKESMAIMDANDEPEPIHYEWDVLDKPSPFNKSEWKL